jgi:uncharacterized protein (TIGR02646 family)
MISLTKGPEPGRLAQNAAKWTAELLSAIQRGQGTDELRKTKYNHPDIKDALKLETRSKCAYCESNPFHVSFGHIEHVVPKSAVPERAYDWSNLTLACDICNVKKGVKEGLIDPYAVDPNQHFRFRGPMITAVPGNAAAKLTCIALDLNRIALLEKRAEKLDELGRRLGEILETKDPNARQILLASLIEHSSDSSREYTGCMVKFISDLKDEGCLPV